MAKIVEHQSRNVIFFAKEKQTGLQNVDMMLRV